MHPAISDFPSSHFYDGKVSSGIRPADRPTPSGFPWPSETIPIAFVRVNDNNSGKGYDSEGDSLGGSGRGQLESRAGVEAAAQGRDGGDSVSPSSSTLGTSYCNHREARAVAVALELVVGGGDVEVKGKGLDGNGYGRIRDIVGRGRDERGQGTKDIYLMNFK